MAGHDDIAEGDISEKRIAGAKADQRDRKVSRK